MTDLDPGAQPFHVLVVDDNAGDRRLIEQMLPSSYEIREAATASQAREAIAARMPDLILLDYRLPDADGTSLLPHIKRRHVAVVMLTGMEAPEIVVAAMQAGAHDYLVKNTLTPESLWRALANATEKARLEQAVAHHQQELARQATALEHKNREVSALARSLTLAEQEERRRVASLLHDHLQQILFGAKLGIGSVLLAESVEVRTEAAGRLEEIIDAAIKTTRDLAVELTPPVLDREELEIAFQWLAQHMEEMYGLRVRVDALTSCRVPVRELRVLMLQLARELLFNVVKHAGVTDARLELRASGSDLIVTVSDRGNGFDVNGLPDMQSVSTTGTVPQTFGLYSVRKRLELLGGRLEVESQPGRGSSLSLRVPVSVGQDLAAPDGSV
jgi:signal transduction histidine kinase